MMGLLNDDRSDKLMMGLLGLQGLAGLSQRPQYTTNIAQATAPQENQWMAQLPGAMALMQRNRLLRDQAKSQMETQALLRDKTRLDMTKEQREQAKRDEYTAALQSGDPDRIAAARAAVNPDAMWQHQYGWQKPQGQIDQERGDVRFRTDEQVRAAQSGRIKTPEEIAQDQADLALRSRLAVQAAQQGRIKTPEEMEQERILLGDKALATIATRETPRLDTTGRKELSEKGGTAATFGNLVSTWSDKYGGYKSDTLGDLDLKYQRYIGGDRAGGADWWQNYQTQKNVIRNQLFGSALTVPEREEFDKAQISPGMKPDVIRKNLARQKAAADAAALKLAKSYIADGYRPEAVEAALGISLSDLQAKPKSAGRLKYNPATGELE